MPYILGMNTTAAFLPPLAVANRLGLPENWLRAEALAGRIPSLRVGRRLMFRPEDVERTLAERAAKACAGTSPQREVSPC